MAELSSVPLVIAGYRGRFTETSTGHSWNWIKIKNSILLVNILTCMIPSNTKVNLLVVNWSQFTRKQFVNVQIFQCGKKRKLTFVEHLPHDKPALGNSTFRHHLISDQDSSQPY